MLTEELPDGELRIRFTSGGMRELAEHLFGWGGDLVIEGPESLIVTMRERLELGHPLLPRHQNFPDATEDVGGEGR